MAFQPGQSGNPSGRPKEAPIVRALARAKTEAAINTLIEIMEDKDASKRERIMAAEVVLDRGWGKAVQAIEHSGGITVESVSDQQARMMAEAYIESAKRPGIRTEAANTVCDSKPS